MGKPEDWYKIPSNKEYIIPLYDPKFNQRIRVRMVKEPHGQHGRKRIKNFYVGYELEVCRLRYIGNTSEVELSTKGGEKSVSDQLKTQRDL